MHVVAAILASALAVTLVVVLPLTSPAAYRRYTRRLQSDPGARLGCYARIMARNWAVAAAVVGIGLLAGRSARSIGLPAYPGGANLGLVAAVLTVSAAAVALAVAATRHRSPAHDDLLLTQLRRAISLLPVSGRERAGYAALSLTAGICEELVFRGFAVAYVRWLWPGAPWAWLIVVTSVPFGLGHLYQGAGGGVVTGVLGALFCLTTLATGTLLPAMIMHAAIDLRNLAVPRELVRRAAAAQQAGVGADQAPPVPT